jgi:hypothetical protein
VTVFPLEVVVVVGVFGFGRGVFAGGVRGAGRAGAR